MRLVGLILVLVVVAAPPAASASIRSAAVSSHITASASQPCTAFGQNWKHSYNARGGPIEIVSVCCNISSPRSHESACSVMVTGRKGMMGSGMFGCSVATVSAGGDILANRPLACVRTSGLTLLPA